MSTKIEWTDETWNPIAGCNDVSEGCRNCYARKMAGRLEAMGVAKYKGLTVLQGSHRVWTGRISFDEKALLSPLSRKKPTRYFVNSMSDLFHDYVEVGQIVHVFAVMALTPWHTYQVLTKRANRMQRLLSDPSFIGLLADQIEAMRTDSPRRAVGPLPHLDGGETWYPLANVWLGVSVEDQKTADERIPLLLQTPAAVRFISAEPLLGAIDIEAVPYVNSEVLDWVIVGGESGPGARPMHPDWARSLRDQCVAAGVPFFFKQWGEWVSIAENPRLTDLWLGEDGKKRGDYLVRGDACMRRVGKKAAGYLLDGKEWHQFPGVK